MKIRPPIFVIGFPRTGTTFLFELLGLHESVQVHKTWEQWVPLPCTDKEDVASLLADRQQRYNSNKFLFNNVILRLFGEAIQHVHRIG